MKATRVKPRRAPRVNWRRADLRSAGSIISRPHVWHFDYLIWRCCFKYTRCTKHSRVSESRCFRFDTSHLGVVRNCPDDKRTVLYNIRQLSAKVLNTLNTLLGTNRFVTDAPLGLSLELILLLLDKRCKRLNCTSRNSR